MMKSFFKKLAFVMALAMVVATMAPAAQASAAEALGIVAQNDDTWTVLETDKAEVGAKDLDYRYKGAPKNYKELDPTWASSDETVATVDKNGVVTTLKDGETVISISLSNGQKGEMKLTVGKTEVVADKSFEVKQTAGDTVKLTFADATQATDKVELYKIFKTSNGDVEAAWPSVVTVKDGVATVKAYVPFVDGEEFLVKANGVTEGFVAYVGQITGIKVVPVTANNGNTYADANGKYPIEFKVTYLAGDIEFTTDPNGGWMTYEALTQNENIYIDATSGLNTYIYSVGASTVVKAVYSYYDKDYNVVELPYEFQLVGYPAPVETFDSVDAYTITNQTDKTKIAWGKTEVVVGDAGYYVGLNVGTTINKNYYVNAPIDKLDDFATKSLGDITFKSSDETKLLVGTTDGSLNAISDGSAVVIVQLTTYDDNNMPHTKNIYAFTVTIKPARYAKDIKLSAPSVTVLTQDNAGGSLTKAEVTYEVVDQYGQTFTSAAKPTVKTTANVAATELEVQAGDPGKGKIIVWGNAYAADKVNNVAYTVEGNNIKKTLNVVPKRPATDKETADVVTTGWTVEVGDVDANVKADKAGALYADVKLFTTWSGVKTGYVTAPYLFDNNDFFTKNTLGTIEKSDLVVKVTGPDGLVVKDLDKNDFEWTTTGLKIKVANVASGSALSIVKEGTYTVELFTVTNVTPSTTATNQSLIANRRVASDTFKVSNTAAKISVKEYGNKLASTAYTIEDAIIEIVTFQGVEGFTVSADDITKVDGVYNPNAGKYYVKSINVSVPINNTNCTYTQTVTIGKTFDVPNLQ